MRPDITIRDHSAPEMSEDGCNPCLATQELVETDGIVLLLTRRKRRLTEYITCCTLWGSTILAGMLLICLVLSISQSVWNIDDDLDKAFARWRISGTGTEGLASYLTDYLRDIVPVPCHSHNDYWRRVPVFSALRVGCTGVEADVWLFDGDSKLYVGHDQAALTPYHTFQSLYVNPILEILEKSNPRTPSFTDNRRGVFATVPDQTLVLLVDLKTDGAETFEQVEAQLEPLRAGNWLTYVEHGVIHARQVTVVGTGGTPFDVLTQNSTYRDIFFDAPLNEFWEDPNTHSGNDDDGPFIYNSTNSFYASTDFEQAVGSVWSGLNEQQLRLIRGQIRGAHRRGLKVRYWNTPSWPIYLRNSIWRTLVAEGADVLNADDLKDASQMRW